MKKFYLTWQIYLSLHFSVNLNCYHISNISYARKIDLDDYIDGSNIAADYDRARVLYGLYACGHLTIADIKYPTYQHWQQQHGRGLSLDHKLPIRWFPNLTFDCTNWQPLPFTENKNKGDGFLDEGIERLEWLSTQLEQIKSKYQDRS
jgi:hypothetical protein